MGRLSRVKCIVCKQKTHSYLWPVSRHSAALKQVASQIRKPLHSVCSFTFPPGLVTVETNLGWEWSESWELPLAWLCKAELHLIETTHKENTVLISPALAFPVIFSCSALWFPLLSFPIILLILCLMNSTTKCILDRKLREPTGGMHLIIYLITSDLFLQISVLLTWAGISEAGSTASISYTQYKESSVVDTQSS